MKKLGIIGYGTLGKILTEILTKMPEQHYEICGIFARHEKENSITVHGKRITIWTSIEELLDSDAEIIVEIAGGGAVKEYGRQILDGGRDFVVTSVGALADQELKDYLLQAAIYNERKIYVTSGAVGGFDLMQIFSLMDKMGLETAARICSTKRPEGLKKEVPSDMEDNNADTKNVLFEGDAECAIREFPKNVNVAVAAGMASVGTSRIKVKVVSDPQISGNTHEITLENKLAKATIKTQAVPDAENPKSSIITAWSVAALLESIVSPIKFF